MTDNEYHPTMEDLGAQIEQITHQVMNELERKDNEIMRLQGIIREQRKLLDELGWEEEEPTDD